MLLLALALAPAIAIIIYIYLKDAHEREPLGMLVKMFFFGVLSVFLTLIISGFVHEFFEPRDDVVFDQFVEAFFGVALIEEFSKFFFVWFAFKSRHFNEPFDGIVYAVMVSMGFAALENVLYVYQGGLSTALLRMFTAVPAHASFGVLMGYFLGKGKFDLERRQLYSLMALGSATVFHGFYDFFLFISFIPGIWLGALASLILALVLTKRAIKEHSDNSPFNIKSKKFWLRFNKMDFDQDGSN